MTDNKPGRWTEYMPLDELAENPVNPKGHADQLIDESLERFGYVEAITLDERTGFISAGHGRRRRLTSKRAASEEPPDGVIVDGDGRWLVPVQRGWASVDDVEAEAYLVASNAIGPAGGWLEDRLGESLNRIADTPLRFAGVGT